MPANQIGLWPKPLEPASAHSQPGAQCQHDDGEADGHPGGMNVGECPRESVVSCGVQLIDLEDGVFRQAGEQGVEGALEILGIAGLEGEHHVVVRVPHAGIRAEHELGKLQQQ